MSVPRWLMKKVSPSPLNSKLNPEAPVFMPKSVIAQKNESKLTASRFSPTIIDLDKDAFDEDEEDIDLGEDNFGENEDGNMLDICFDKVARDGISHQDIKEVKVTKIKRRHMKGNTIGMIK